MEDSLDCPLVELGLVRATAERQAFHFNCGYNAVGIASTAVRRLAWQTEEMIVRWLLTATTWGRYRKAIARILSNN